MPKSDHAAAVSACAVAASLLAEVDLEAVIDAGQRALDFGPLLHPSEWMAKHKALEEDLEVLRAARPLAAMGRKLRELREASDAET